MTFRSHIALGLLGGFALTYAPNIVPYSESEIISVLPLIALGSVFPDIDEPNSFIGKKIPVFSHIVSSLFGHRGFTHFLLFPVILISLGLYVIPLFSLWVYAFCFGIVMHQIGDMMTKSGIPSYFFPFSYGILKHRAVLAPSFLRFRTGSGTEMFFVLPLLLSLIALVIWDKYGKFLSQQVWRFLNG